MKFHVVICFIFMLFIAITQNYYGRKMYNNKDEKSYKQYKIVTIINAALLLTLVAVGIYLADPFNLWSQP